MLFLQGYGWVDIQPLTRVRKNVIKQHNELVESLLVF